MTICKAGTLPCPDPPPLLSICDQLRTNHTAELLVSGTIGVSSVNPTQEEELLVSVRRNYRCQFG